MATTLHGKVALITGASSGIGEAAAIALAAEGATVVLSARRADRLQELVKTIEANGGVAVAMPGDVTDAEVAERTVSDTIERFGKLDILVNSAGIIQAGNVEDANFDDWRRVMEVNFFGTLHTCKPAVRHMKARGAGDIVNVSSLAGRRTARLFSAYSPSKFALNSFSEALRQEVGGSGIRVCVVEPGATESEVAENIRDPEWREMMRKHVSKDGAMKAKDIADAIIFAVSMPQRANVSEIIVRPTIDIAAQF